MNDLTKFKLWHGLNLKENLEEQAQDIINKLECGIDGTYFIDNEGMFKVIIVVKYIDQLKDLAYILDDNIVIYGVDSDIIMTVKTMNELGLG